MNELSKLVKNLKYDDLVLLKKDLDEGNLNKLINSRLKDEKKEELSTCPVCGMVVRRDKGLYLEFGNEIRKRAIFDGVDCLDYFLKTLK
jgi:hypothetical protein